MIIWPAKAPEAVEKYAFDFTEALNGATISGTPTVTPDGVTVAGTAVVTDNAGTRVEMMLSAGTAGTVATVECLVVTDGGETLYALGVLAIGGDAADLATAKAAQRIDDSDEDALLAAFLRAAIGTVERQTGKNLTQKIVTQKVDGFPGCGSGSGFAYAGFGYAEPYHANAGARQQAIRLWQGPVSSILDVKYDDSNGVEQTLTNFRLVEGANAMLLPAYGASFPLTARGPGTVRLTYVAGYAAAELPPELTQAAILLFGHFNANREAVMADTRAAAVELPLGVEMLIAPYCEPGIA